MPKNLFFKNNLLYIFAAAKPLNIPSSIPAATSVGKCTYRYNLENAIAAATNTAGFHRLHFVKYIAETAANDAAECPDGNE